MVTLLPKKEKKKPLFRVGMIYDNAYSLVSLLTLFLVVSVYFGFIWYAEFLGGKVAEVEAELVEIQEKRNSDLEQKVIDFASRLRGIDSLLNSHIYSSKIFPFIEKIVHPEVQFTNFMLNTKNGTVSLVAVTRDYTTLGEQIIALRKNKELINLEISGVNLRKTGEITFNVSFGVDERVYR